MKKKFDLDGTVANTEHGTLSKLWRIIIRNNRLKPRLKHMINAYTNDTIKLNIKNVKRKTKSSLGDNVYADEMTWKTFNNLVFGFLNMVRMDITIKLTSANGEESIHSVVVKNPKKGHDYE